MTIPSDIAGLQAWYKPDTSTVSNGGLIASLADSSGNGHTLGQATSSRQPKYRTNITPNGGAVLRNDGVDDNMTYSAVVCAGDLTVFWCAQFTNFGSARSLIANTNNNTFINQSASSIGFRNESGSQATLNHTTIAAATFYRVILVRSGTSWTRYVNGVANGTTTLGGTLTFNLTGSQGSGSAQMAGDIAELGLYTVALSASQVAQIDAYLADRFFNGTPRSDYAGPLWYAAPTGLAAGDGSIDRPWDLQSALNDNGLILPGQTIYLRDGTFTGDVDSTLPGASGNAITITPYPAEHPIVNGRLRIYGNDTTWRDGIEFCYLDWVRRQSAFNGLNPPDVPGYSTTLEIRGIRTKLINCVMHDLGECELWEPAVDSEVYGCVIYNNGFNQLSNGGVGHALYTQNDTGTPLIKHNIVVSAYNFGIHAYGSSLANLNNYQFIENIHTNVAFLVGGLGSSKVTNVLVQNNRLFRSGLNTGYNATHNTSVTIEDNLLAGDPTRNTRLQVLRFDGSVTVRNNTIVETDTGGDGVEWIPTSSNPQTVVFDWDSNTYWSAANETVAHFFETPGYGAGFYTFAQWEATFGFDAASTYHNLSTPTGTQIDVFPSIYGGAHLGCIAIYNWSGASSVNVDLSALGLDVGATYALRNAANYYNELLEFRYGGGLVSVPMTGWTVAVPIAAAAALFPSTFPTFGAFVVTLVAESVAELPYIGDVYYYDASSPTGTGGTLQAAEVNYG